MRKFFLRTFNLDGGGAGAGGSPGAGGSGGGSPAAGGQGGGEGGGGSPAAGGSSLAEQIAQRAGQQPDGQPGQQSVSGTAYYPDGMPDSFRGMSDKETIDKLYADYSGRPKAPAADKDYKFAPSDDFAKSYGDLKDDPALPVFRKIAHKYQLPQEAFNGMIQDVYQEFEKAGLIEGPLDAEAEVTKLAGDKGAARDRYVKAHQRISAVEQFVRGLQTKGEITKADAVILGSMASSADAVVAFEKIMRLIPGEHGLQSGGSGAGSGYSWSQADADMADERYSSNSPKYDPRWRASVDEKMRGLAPRGKARVFS